MRKLAIIILFLTTILSLVYSNDIGAKMVKLYENGEYSELRKELSATPKSNLNSYLGALVMLNDPVKPDFALGVSNLSELQKTLPKGSTLWNQVTLTLARTVQLLQRRGDLYSFSHQYDYKELFLELIREDKESVEACRAVVYWGEDVLFDSSINFSKVVDEVELFCNNFAGERRNIVPVYLFLDKIYIYKESDYQKSFQVLKKAFEIGIASENIRQSVLFRLGRMADLKLKDSKSAKEYYLLFLKEYPDSAPAPAVKEYLAMLSDRGDN